MDVSELIAIEEIKRLKARYFRAADEKDWHTLRGLFTDDARAWYPGPARWFTGADEIVAWASGFLGPGTIIVHHGFMPEITIATMSISSSVRVPDAGDSWGPDTTVRSIDELEGNGRFSSSCQPGSAWMR
jgi:hypothetical protein